MTPDELDALLDNAACFQCAFMGMTSDETVLVMLDMSEVCFCPLPRGTN